MSEKRVLMLSSSKVGNEEYLANPRKMILPFLDKVKTAIFIPYAGVTMSWDDYTEKVQQALPEIRITGIHTLPNAADAINNAQAIIVGGGNTFNLLYQLQSNDIIKSIQNKVNSGTPYIGWSAGSNICGLSIKTTNDMPIIQPESFSALAFVPLQINPHYSDYQPPGHNGETRAQRIAEFCVLNPDTHVIGIREGSGLLLQGDTFTLIGELDGVIFKGNQQQTIAANTALNNLLK
ncbi:dipeptidase PepE [Aliiglaciecola sp. NS0011-25]|uniref:dipeptidase PepE n=1 Tax=Aliiglaciecola sp. NS0011-25 TaxID=3127654 RepID=UPI00310AE103